MGETKSRTVRIDDELWAEALAETASRSETVSDLIRRALLAYVADPTATMVALTQIRGGGR
jgi:Arc/MetJ family transcription regulator